MFLRFYALRPILLIIVYKTSGKSRQSWSSHVDDIDRLGVVPLDELVNIAWSVPSKSCDA